ncbi:MAG: bifunctional folylpolyglutamate synthase/dihydrofolate synthase [Armatimonadetes bacterium]|nr:bifunctional folylpolyglutamate synthase/dihydrofolate synthase [Armatimonadota bacterium]MDE2207864.1 bifunctional folylpolyglutamate synthase/dihydrofolate synthase [Armatimonadota bacterium]
MNFDEALAYMSGLLRFGVKLGNDRFEELMRRLDNPHRELDIVHVAGTKGKGSTTVMAAAILHAAGKHTGSYFSPYVYDVCERVQVDGEPISHDDFARIVTAIRPVVDAVSASDLGAVTEFELKTAVAFMCFAEQRVTHAAVEVGLGGRLDATNVVTPSVTVITNIGLDHMATLGDTTAKIAREKAGIIKPGIPCFTAARDEAALQVIRETAAERQAPLTLVRSVGSVDAAPGSVLWSVPANEPHGGSITISTCRAVYNDVPMRLLGGFQRENAACAVGAVEEQLVREGVVLQDAWVRQALAEATLPGRLELWEMPGGVLLVLDGAHNAMASEELSQALRDLAARWRAHGVTLVVGMLQGHDPKGFLEPIAPLAARLIACRPPWKRALSAETIADAARPLVPEVTVVRDPLTAAHRAIREAEPHGMVVITGSFYTLGAAAAVRGDGRPAQLAAPEA